MMISERALVLAPQGRDGMLAASLLKDVGRDACACASFYELLQRLDEGAGLAIIAIEALQYANLKPLTEWIEKQPPWSDFPFVVLTHRVGSADQHPMLQKLQVMVGNVIFLDRPFHPSSFVNVVENSLRGRRRQHQARQYLEELREGEDRLTTALMAGQMGSWSLQIAGHLLEGSQQFKSTFGRSASTQFSYEELIDGIAETDRAQVQASITNSAETGADFEAEFPFIWPDGTRHWINCRARAVGEKAAGTLTLIGVASDITTRKTADIEREKLLAELALERERTQQALLGERALSGLLLTSVPAGIVGYGDDLKVTIWNPVMERLFGVDEAAAVGKPLAELVADGEAAKILPRLEDVLDGIAGPIEQIELTSPSGQITLESQHAPLRGGDGTIVGGAAFFRDIPSGDRLKNSCGTPRRWRPSAN